MHGVLPLHLLALICSMLPSFVNAEENAQTGQASCKQQVSPLNNDEGDSPCAVARQLLYPCFPNLGSLDESGAGRWLDAYANSTCSCNTAVYNLLSACQLCQRPDANTALFSNWTSKCSSQGINVTNYYPIANVSVHVPMWASADLSSANFNSQGALSAAASDPWSPVQIVLPILTGLAVFLVCVALFLWYRSKHRNPYTHANAGNSFLSRFRRGPSPVIHERLESWVIDMEPPEHPSRLSSYSTDSSGSGIDHKPAPRSKLTSPLSFHTKIFSGKSPLPVHSLPRRQGFRIDDTDLSTKAASRSSTMVIGRTTHSHEDEEQSVLLISQNPGVDFTIESSAVQSPRTDRAEAGGDVGFEIKPPSPTQPELPDPYPHPHLPNPHSDPTTPQHSPSPSPSPSPGHQYTYISLPPLTRGDPSNLIPTPVRAAGYDPFRASVSSLGSRHSRNPSAESLYWNGNPSIGDPVLPPGDLSIPSPTGATTSSQSG